MRKKYLMKIVMAGMLFMAFSEVVSIPVTVKAELLTYDDLSEEEKQRMKEAREQEKVNSMNGIRGNCNYLSLLDKESVYNYILNHPAFPFDDSMNAAYIDVNKFLTENPAFAENGINTAEQIISWYQAEGYKTQCKLYVTDSAPLRVRQANLSRNKAIEYGVYLNGSLTVTDKVKIINDNMCKDFEYDYGMYYYDYDMDYKDGYIYGICMDYSQYFEIIAAYAGINAGILKSTISNHAWNAVQLEDGQWYQVDVTWNDTEGKKTKYLLTKKHGGNVYVTDQSSWISEIMY